MEAYKEQKIHLILNENEAEHLKCLSSYPANNTLPEYENLKNKKIRTDIFRILKDLGV